MWFAFSPVAAQRVDHVVEDVGHVLDVGLNLILVALLVLFATVSHTRIEFVEFTFNLN